MSPGRLFIVGGTGFIGTVLIEHAITDGYKVSSHIPYHIPNRCYPSLRQGSRPGFPCGRAMKCTLASDCGNERLHG